MLHKSFLFAALPASMLSLERNCLLGKGTNEVMHGCNTLYTHYQCANGLDYLYTRI